MTDEYDEYSTSFADESLGEPYDVPPPPPSTPTFSPMTVSRSNLIYSGRTTTCDIMSVINTTSVFKRSTPSPEKSSPFKATLPYKKNKAKLGNVLNADTPWTKLQLFKSQKERNVQLIRERNYFMNELANERSDEEWHQHRCATKIQAAFRGFRTRPRTLQHYDIQRTRKKVRNTARDIQDELYAHAKLLKLTVIPGLTLEPRGKESRRRRKIAYAASIQIQEFFKMIVARRYARIRLEERKHEIRNLMARKLVRFFRYLFMLSFTKKADKMKRGANAVIIQNCVRSFIARNRVRLLKRGRLALKRQNHSSTVITRNYLPYVKKVQEERERPIGHLADLLVDRYLYDECFEQEFGESVHKESLAIYQGELQTEAVRGAFSIVIGELVDHSFDTEVDLYIEEQIQILEDMRKKLEEERLALESERIRLEEEIERARQEEEDKKRKEAERLAKQAEVRRLAEKARLDAEKETQRAEMLHEKARLESHSAVSDAPDANADDLSMHDGSHEERFERAKTYEKYCRFRLSLPILSKLLLELIELQANSATSNVELKVGAHGDRLLKMSAISMLAGRCHYELGEFLEAKERYVYAEEIREKVVGLKHALVAEAEVHLAKLYFVCGQYSEAEASYKEAFSILEEKYSSIAADAKSNDEVLARRQYCCVYVGLAELHRCIGNYSLAENAIDSALDFVKTHYTELEVERKEMLADCFFVEAHLYTTQGLLKDAIHTHQEALDLRLELYGMDQHPAVASSMTQLGRLALSRCQLADALRLLEKATEIRQQFFSPDHLCIAESMFAKSKWLQMCGRYHEASLHMEKSLQVRQTALGPSHHLVAQSMHGLAEITRERGSPAAAHPLYEAALSMRRECFPCVGNQPLHKRIVESIQCIGVNTMARGRYTEAATFFERANHMREDLLDKLDVENHWEIEAGNIALAECYYNLGKYSLAKPLLTSAGKFMVSVFSGQHTFVAESLLILGRTCTMQGLYNDAAALFENCLRLQKSIFGDKSPRLVATYQAMCTNFLGPGRYDDAIEACNVALDILSSSVQAAPEMDNSAVVRIASSMPVHHMICTRAHILRDTGTLEDAQILYEQALAMIDEMFGEEKSTHYSLTLGELGECLRLQGNTEQAEIVLRQSLALRTEQFGESHVYVGDNLRYLALLLLDKNLPDAALDMVEEAILPQLQELLGNDHPTIVFLKGIVGLCLKLIHSNEFHRGLSLQSGEEDNSDSADNHRQNLRENLDYAQNMIDDALDFFDAYTQGCFCEMHPWVLRLGGFLSANSSRASTARPSSRLSTANSASYLSLRVATAASSLTARAIHEEMIYEGGVGYAAPDSPDRFSTFEDSP